MSASTEKMQPSRRRSGTATWHMSREAVSLSFEEVLQWSEKQCLDFFVEVRFGSWDTVTCPHCSTVGKHYWRERQQRWKCAGCGSTFSITSKTVFASRKKSLRQILGCVLTWLNSAAGQSALELKRHSKMRYNTVFVIQHKMREAFVRGFNVGLVSGDIEMDGAHTSGRRAAEKRGKPKTSQPLDENNEDDKEKMNALLRASGKKSGRSLPKDRRLLISVRKRAGARGKGANATRIAIGLDENSDVVKTIVKRFVAPSESMLNTDGDPAYTEPGQEFLAHRVVNHKECLSGPNGENNNQAEELNARYKRAERGVYLNIEPKYMLDYAVETSFRSDTRRLPNGQQLKLAMSLATKVGESQFWTGFTRGRHRDVELLMPQPRPAAASGPKKGRSPISSANGRPPR